MLSPGGVPPPAAATAGAAAARGWAAGFRGVEMAADPGAATGPGSGPGPGAGTAAGTAAPGVPALPRLSSPASQPALPARPPPAAASGAVSAGSGGSYSAKRLRRGGYSRLREEEAVGFAHFYPSPPNAAADGGGGGGAFSWSRSSSTGPGPSAAGPGPGRRLGQPGRPGLLSADVEHGHAAQRRSRAERALRRLQQRVSPGGRRALLVLAGGAVLTLLLACYLFVRSDVTRFCVLAVISALGAVLFSAALLAWVLAADEGPLEMRQVAAHILEGSESFFRVQYSAIARITALFAGGLFLLFFFRDVTVGGEHVSSAALATATAATFALGAFCSALAGYAGMWVSVRANVRVAAAARCCANSALQLCFRGGAIGSVVNVALAVGGVAGCLLALRCAFPGLPLRHTPLLLVGYGFGASLVAMFAQLGGGIYTKAADVGADLVGKIEAGIPEDDPRNAAVIADLVGDNVGDCAGQCADLFESVTAEIISAMILGGALAGAAGLPEPETAGYVLFPLAVHCMDLLVSGAGVLAVRSKRGLPDAESAPGGPGDPLRVMVRCYFFTCVAALAGFAFLCRSQLYTASNPRAWLWYSACGGVGMACAFLFVLITQRYTDYHFSKVRRIAEASVSGPATNVIAGLSVGLESTAGPVLLISGCVTAAYYFGTRAAPGPGAKLAAMSGLFGTAVATMGMLCTAVFVLAMSNFGPIADNAGGIAEMAQQPAHVRAVTDRLDAVGNVTKANTKGFSVGTASLACFLLFSAFMDEVEAYTRKRAEAGAAGLAARSFSAVNIAEPDIFIAGLLGSALVFLFCAWALEAVGRAAQQVVHEVRRQFRQIPGLLEGTAKPDYHTCVAIVSKAALREMVRPGLLAVLSPVAVGLAFRALGQWKGEPQRGAEAVAAYLMFATATGILMALFLNNAGGAWDNAKKYVETGAMGGKNSDCHRAAVVGDTVGDPCKDTAGPSVHVLMKLISTVTMVVAPLFVAT